MGTKLSPVGSSQNNFSATGVQTAVLTADFPKTNDTLEAVTGWSSTIYLEAGNSYRITVQGQCNENISAGGFVFNLNGGTATFTGYRGLSIGYDTKNSDWLSGSADPIGGGVVSTSDGLCIATFELTVNVATSGTLNAMFGQNTTDAVASVLNKYATISAQQISPTPAY